MPLLRFLQFSDLHLDCSLASTRLDLPPEKRAQINRDLRGALVRVTEIAKAEKVDVVLCPGDLWEDESVGFETAVFAYETLGSLSPIPVIITPGNHDCYHGFSYHHPRYFQMKTGKAHPSNITVFASPSVERRTLPDLPEVDFYGCCFEQNLPRTERILRGVTPERPGAISVLLLHGSQDDQGVPPAAQQMTAPFSRAELLATGFDYAALGHYHRYSEIASDDGRLRGAYSGVPISRTLAEGGEHFILAGEIGKGGIVAGSLQRIRIDTRQVHRLTTFMDASVMHSAAACRRVEQTLRSANVGDRDIVHVTLSGRMHPEINCFDFDQAWRDSLCFHLAIDQSQLEPEYDLEGILADCTSNKRIEGQFADRMKHLMMEAADDPERQRLLKSALFYGLDALRGKEVKPRRVH